MSTSPPATSAAVAPAPDTPEGVLHSVFGYSHFKPLQREVIGSVLAGRDTLVIMPTGGGKSLCYQVPALLRPGLTLVVSPLIALMKDQVEQMQALGVPALTLHSAMELDAYQQQAAQVRRGEVRLLYVAPETLFSPRFQEIVDGLRVSCVAIDEAHCISEWGHDFRPEYRQLAEVRKRFAGVTCMALTATATPRVRADITGSLGFAEHDTYVGSFDRENLFLEILPRRDPTVQILELARRFEGQAGIVYCFSRKQVDTLAAELVSHGLAARPYHAGLDDETRHRNQEAFVRDDVQVIVATIAFGMGINKPNVRFVAHHDLPRSLEAYYQEIGRAGRDSLPAHCLLLYSFADVRKHHYFIDQKEPREREAAERLLDDIVRYAEHDLSCRRHLLLSHFGESYDAENCQMCDHCVVDEASLVDVSTPALKFLSCVKRTGERFGAGHVIDVLLGSRRDKVIARGHDKLSTFGIGTELDRDQWMHLGHQLVQKGFLEQRGEYRTLALTPRAYAVFKSRAPILGVIRGRAASRPTRQPAPEPVGSVDHDVALFQLLRARRKELADEGGVPPYVIFSDRTLVEMAGTYPRELSAMLRIHGVGQVKASRYGEAFLTLIREYCQEHGIGGRP
jgi:ATP-dependent DNA helicase RecQ